jgi:tetratricopeptide (TPR) repeat protein
LYKSILSIIIVFMLVGCNSNLQEYDKYIKKGTIELKEEKYSEAILSFEMALKAKPKDKSALKLLKDAKNKAKIVKNKPKKSDDKVEPVSLSKEPTIIIEKNNGKFYINGITLQMGMGDIVSKWGKPDSIEKPDPDDSYFSDDYDEWQYLKYGDFTLTLYSDVLRIVMLRPDDFVFETKWYKDLGNHDEFTDNEYVFKTDEQYLSFSSFDDPYMQWAELDPTNKESTTNNDNNNVNINDNNQTTVVTKKPEPTTPEPVKITKDEDVLEYEETIRPFLQEIELTIKDIETARSNGYKADEERNFEYYGNRIMSLSVIQARVHYIRTDTDEVVAPLIYKSLTLDLENCLIYYSKVYENIMVLSQWDDSYGDHYKDKILKNVDRYQSLANYKYKSVTETLAENGFK